MIERLSFRMAEKSDVHDILSIYGPIIEKTVISFEYQIPTPEDMWQRIQRVQEEAPWLVCSAGDLVVGYAYAAPHRNRRAYQWNRELSVYVHQDYRNRLIATTLYQSLFSILELQGFTNALIGITLPNPVSVRLHEKLGFALIGHYRDVGFKMGKYHSVGWWQKKLSLQRPGNIVPWQSMPSAIGEILEQYTSIINNR